MAGSEWNIQKINEIIKTQGFNKKYLADKLNISPQLLSYYLTNPPTIYKGLKLAQGLSTRLNKIDWKDLID